MKHFIITMNYSEPRVTHGKTTDLDPLMLVERIRETQADTNFTQKYTTPQYASRNANSNTNQVLDQHIKHANRIDRSKQPRPTTRILSTVSAGRCSAGCRWWNRVNRSYPGSPAVSGTRRRCCSSTPPVRRPCTQHHSHRHNLAARSPSPMARWTAGST